MTHRRPRAKRLTHAGAMAAIASGRATRVVRGLLSMALYGDDGMLAGRLCLKHIDNPDEQIRGGAVRALGYVAAVHGCLDDAVVAPAINRALLDPSDYVREQACCAMDVMLGVAGFGA